VTTLQGVNRKMTHYYTKHHLPTMSSLGNLGISFFMFGNIPKKQPFDLK